MVTAISTDLGNTALFPALCSGGTLALIKPEVALDSTAFMRRLEGAPLDVLKVTPSHLNALLATGASGVLPRRWLVLGGERLGWDLVDRVRELGDCQILNHYGPTETTVGSCTMLVEARGRVRRPTTVPIGRPLANTRLLHPGRAGWPRPAGRLGAAVHRRRRSRPRLHRPARADRRALRRRPVRRRGRADVRHGRPRPATSRTARSSSSAASTSRSRSVASGSSRARSKPRCGDHERSRTRP